MFAIADGHGEGVLLAVPRARSLALLDTYFFAGIVGNDAVAELVVAPAEGDHVIILLPVAEGVVGGVDDDQGDFAVLEALVEMVAEPPGPGGAVVVADNDVVLGQI